jgi:hypothetical protein
VRRDPHLVGEGDLLLPVALHSFGQHRTKAALCVKDGA